MFKLTANSKQHKQQLTVIVLPGFMGNASEFCNLFDESIHVVCVDYTKPCMTDFDTAVDCLFDVIANYKQCVLFGYSMGGRLAYGLLAKYAYFFRAAIIMSSAPYVAQKVIKQQFNQLIIDKLQSLPARQFYQFWHSLPLFGSLITHCDYELYLKQRLNCFNQQLYIEILRQLPLMPDYRKALKDCFIPVLLLTGKNDDKYTIFAQDVNQYLVKAKHFEVSQAAHACYVEQSVIVKKTMAIFLKNN